MIVEAEAYGFSDDSASHAFGGITRRNYVMFGEAGRAYVYYSYGRHFCVNVSARSPEIQAGAVLIRALQPLEGLAFMKNHRNNSKDLLLTSGPGRLSQAVSISPSVSGIDMTDPRSELHIEFGVAPQGIKSTPRIGTSKAPYKMWRFILLTDTDRGNPTKFASRRW
jgi:DNA-3-methyladenine glycosylase